jgi:2-oxoisovalerate dehydrogenase E1 component alpha subunit
LATQIPHAVGAALALRSAEGSDESRVAVTYFGDGAASEGDFFCALNFAAALEAPALFLCRNNGWAISTPASEQYAGDGVASRACALGVDALRVDGNDALAVRAGVFEMRRRVALNQRPALVELMTYRLSHHSTSDDATQYRRAEEQREARLQGPILHS